MSPSDCIIKQVFQNARVLTNEFFPGYGIYILLKRSDCVPPKPKFTRKQVVSAALDIVEREGIGALTARELGNEMGSSARPIFTLFANMEELNDCLLLAARERFEQYVLSNHRPGPFFRQVGMRMVSFAVEQPNLFRFLFMYENSGAKSFDQIYDRLGNLAEVCINSIMEEHKIDRNSAKKVFENLWIFTFGIGALCATGMCKFSMEKLEQMLAFEFKSVMYQVVNPDIHFLEEK